MTLREAWEFLDGPPIGHRRDLRARAEAIKALRQACRVASPSGPPDEKPVAPTTPDEPRPE
jgi:hypothetical protein